MDKKCMVCNKNSTFKRISDNKHRCSECGNKVYSCKNENCNNMIKLGEWCSSCLKSNVKYGEVNCPHCKKRTTFYVKENNKYKCGRCENEFKKCFHKECNNMVNLGGFCSKCIGKGIKDSGAKLLTVTGAAVIVGFCVFTGKKPPKCN